MTIQEKTEVIRQKCIEANPLKFRRPKGTDPIWWEAVVQKPSIADVLLAINRNTGMDKPTIKIDGKGLVFNNRDKIFWNLRKDTLEDQSEETTEFIYNLLK